MTDELLQIQYQKRYGMSCTIDFLGLGQIFTWTIKQTVKFGPDVFTVTRHAIIYQMLGTRSRKRVILHNLITWTSDLLKCGSLSKSAAHKSSHLDSLESVYHFVSNNRKSL